MLGSTCGDNDDGRTVKYHYFADLRRLWESRSAAGRIPLLIWHDTISPASENVANFHHDFFSLYVIQRGRGTHVIDRTPYSVARGDVYAMGPGMRHHFADCHDLRANTLHFAPDVFDPATLDALTETPGFHGLFVAPIAASSGANRWLHLSPAAYEEIASLVAELHMEWSSGTPSGTLLTPGLFLRLLVRLSRHRAQNAGESPALFAAGAHEDTVTAAVRFMDEHFAEPLRVEQIAARAFLSPHRFTEVFARSMGRTPRDYLRYLRVEHAKTLLTKSDSTVAVVAEQVGLGDAAYLTRVLRETTGLTPAAYRRQSRAG